MTKERNGPKDHRKFLGKITEEGLIKPKYQRH